jgi:hypothetical protein
VDAYSDYIMSLSKARTSELRREAAEYALSRASRDRTSLWTRSVSWLGRRPRASVERGVPVVASLTFQPASRPPST